MQKVLRIGSAVLCTGSSVGAVLYGVVALFTSGYVFLGIAATTFLIGSTTGGISLFLSA